MNFLRIIFFAGLVLFLGFITGCKSKQVATENKSPITLDSQTRTIVNPKYQYSDNDGSSLKVEVEGLSEITDSGRQVAYDSAVRHGLRNAVEKALGVYVDSQTQVKNQALIRDEIYTRAYGFVEKYEINQTYIDQGVLYQKLSVWVVLDDIKDTALGLDLIQDRVGRPSVYININEVNFSEVKTDFTEKIMSEIFLEKRFNLIKDENLRQGEIEITGEVTANLNDISKNKYLKDTSLQSVTTRLSLTAATKSDRKVIAAFSDKATKLNLNPNDAMAEGIEDMAKKGANSFIRKILNRWDLVTNNGREYIIFISGLATADTQPVKDYMKKSVQGVREVFDQGYQDNTLTLLVRFTGSVDELAGYAVSSRNPTSLSLTSYQGKVIYLKKLN